MKDIDICYGLYAAKWGLTDFYEESEKKLKDALASGEDFDTGWWGCSKEIRSARIVRDDEDVTVEVSCNMDDLFDGDALIYDALWEECHTEEELPDEIIDSIRDAAIDDGIDDSTVMSDTLPSDASFDDIVAKIDRLEEWAEAKNTEMYGKLRAIVKAHVEYMNSQEQP